MYMLRDVFYYGQKPNVHPRERFAKDLNDARHQATTEHFWIINEFCDYSTFNWEFDFDFLPDEDVWAVDHNNIWPSQHQKDSGTWLCPKEHSDINIYRSDVDPVLRKNIKSSNWVVLNSIDETKFDFSWHPDPLDPPYVYVFGNTQYPATLMPTVEYHVEGATELKYSTENLPTLKAEPKLFKHIISVENFNYSWRPHPHDPPYIYVFGNQWNTAQIEPTIEFHTPNATEKKYINDIIAYVGPNYTNWVKLLHIKSFDYSWRPNPYDPPYIYVFGNQFYDAIKEPTLEYHVPGAKDKKYIKDLVAIVENPTMENWTVNYTVENFDYSWHPDPDAPPMIYQFGTLLDDIHLKDGPIYTVPGNDGTVVYLENKIKITYPKYYIVTTLEDLIAEHPNEIFWACRDNIDYTHFNFDWVPTKQNVFHINVFGSSSSEITQTYFINGNMIRQGHMQKNFVDNKELSDEYLASLFKPLDMFYIDKGNNESNQRYEQLKEKFPNLQKTRYINSWVDTINRCITKSSTELCWILNSELDYSNFNFEYYPNPWQMKMIHVFGTQWNHWGSTFIVNSETFANDTKNIKVIEHLPNINLVKKIKAKATNCLHDIFLIDFENDQTQFILNQIKEKTNSINIKSIKYDRNYLQTFKNILNNLSLKKDHYIWICSSICNYDTFDFSYICDPFAKEQLHVFPSDYQKFGDTFFVNVNKLRDFIENINLLDAYEGLNFNNTQRVKRLECPVIVNKSDTLTDFVNYSFNFPYAVFKTFDNQNLKIDTTEPPTLWSNESKTITQLSEGGTSVFIPKEAKNYVVKELYDYPYIQKTKKLVKSNPLDIVFLSNGEINADENYEHLLKITQGLPNRVIRVDGINGRVNAYHAAANASNTPWMFTVFAKLKVDSDFNWNWQPDRLQVPKHYIFYASNPLNGLEYGHQAMIAYNKKIVLSNNGVGLDFTLDSEHEVIPLNSGVANFNTDAFSTWRTSFREVIKLRKDNSSISKSRLDTWLSIAIGDYQEYCIRGANDAMMYYEEVNGDLDKLKLSYDWAWLKDRFTK